MPDYTRICVNMAKSALMAFVLHVPIVIHCLLECLVTYFNEVYSLKKQAFFLKRQNLIFSIIAESF